MRTLIRTLSVFALLCALVAPASAQYASEFLLRNGEQVGVGTTSLNAIYVPILVKYIGTDTSKTRPTVAVAAGGAISFTTDGSTADTDVICPSGGTGGTIDVTNGDCDTLGEVVDVINGTDDYRAVILDGFRTDSSNNTLTTLAATVATAPNGVALYGDSAVNFDVKWAATTKRSINDYITPSGAWRDNPFTGDRAILDYWNMTSTYGSGTSTITVYSVVPVSGQTSETVTTLYSESGGATTAANEQAWANGLWGKKNQKMVVELNNSAAMSAVAFYVSALEYFYR